MELTATEGGGLKRIDVKEISNHLRSLATILRKLHSVSTGNRTSSQPSLGMDPVPRYQRAGRPCGERAVTTLVTSEGKTLTEIKLTVKNQAQPFLKVTLPAGASILSAECCWRKGQARARSGRQSRPVVAPGISPDRSL